MIRSGERKTPSPPSSYALPCPVFPATQRGRARNTAFFHGRLSADGQRTAVFPGECRRWFIMAKKKHIPLFDDQLEMLELLTDQEVGQAVLAAMRFMRSGTGNRSYRAAPGWSIRCCEPSSSGTRTTPPSGKRAASPEKPRRNPGFRKPKPLNGTKRNRTEPDRTEQNRTRRNRTGREVETAAPEGALSHPPWMKCGLMFCRDARRWSPRPSSTFTRPGAGWWERPPCGTGRPPAAVRSPGSAGAGPRPRPRSPTRPHDQIRGLVMGGSQEWGVFPATVRRGRESPHFPPPLPRFRQPDGHHSPFVPVQVKGGDQHAISQNL